MYFGYNKVLALIFGFALITMFAQAQPEAYTPLQEAVLDYNIQAARDLIAAGADVEVGYPTRGDLLDGWSVVEGLIKQYSLRNAWKSTELIRALLSGGARVTLSLEIARDLVPFYFREDIGNFTVDEVIDAITYYPFVSNARKLSRLLKRLQAPGILEPAWQSQLRLALLIAVRRGFVDSVEVLLHAGAKSDLAAQHLVTDHRDPDFTWHDRLRQRFAAAANVLVRNRAEPESFLDVLPADVVYLLPRFIQTARSYPL